MQFQSGSFCGGGGGAVPGVRLVQDCYTGQYRISEHIARVEHGDFGDILMVKAGHIPRADLSDRLMGHMSTQAFPARFNASALQADEYGHISLIPGPLSFNCNIYNQTLFEENGWTVPENYEELFGSEPGDRSDWDPGLPEQLFRLGDTELSDLSVLRLFRAGYSDAGGRPELAQQTHGGRKVPLDPMETAFRDMRRMIEIGAVSAEDMDVPFKENLEAMTRREVAIGNGEIDHIRLLNDNGGGYVLLYAPFQYGGRPGLAFESGVLFRREPGVEAARQREEVGGGHGDHGVYRLRGGPGAAGGGRAWSDARHDWRGDPGRPGVGGNSHPDRQRALYHAAHLRYVFPRAGAEIAAFIRGETDSREILEKCGLLLEQEPAPVQVLGEAGEDFTILQSGCLKADALRAAAGTDIALVGISEVNGYDPVGKPDKAVRGSRH